jgi:hypothetical protein
MKGDEDVAEAIDDYLEGVDEPARKALQALRRRPRRC